MSEALHGLSPEEGEEHRVNDKQLLGHFESVSQIQSVRASSYDREMYIVHTTIGESSVDDSFDR